MSTGCGHATNGRARASSSWSKAGAKLTARLPTRRLAGDVGHCGRPADPRALSHREFLGRGHGHGLRRRCRARTDNAPANFATCRHIAYNLTRKAPRKDSIRSGTKPQAGTMSISPALSPREILHPIPLCTVTLELSTKSAITSYLGHATLEVTGEYSSSAPE
jgi:hypothetical protein